MLPPADRGANAFAALALPVDLQARAGQHPINGGGADRQDLVLDDRVEVEMAMSFHGVDQHRDQSLQPLAAHTVGRLPQHDQRLLRGLVVGTVAILLLDIGCALAIQGPDGVLAVAARQRYELVENLLLVAPRRVSRRAIFVPKYNELLRVSSRTAGRFAGLSSPAPNSSRHG